MFLRFYLKNLWFLEVFWGFEKKILGILKYFGVLQDRIFRFCGGKFGVLVDVFLGFSRWDFRFSFPNFGVFVMELAFEERNS